MANVERWIQDIPPITRLWVAASVLTSVAVQCRMLAEVQLWFSWKTAFGNWQVWRALTNFLYFGPMSVELVLHLFFIMRYSRQLEESSYAGRKADYAWLLFCCSCMLLLISPLFTKPFLSAPLSFALVYIWSRRNPSVRMSLMGVVTVTAPYMPLCFIAFSWFMYGGWEHAISDVLGCIVGHLFWFGQDVWPLELASGGKGWFDTPRLVRRLIDGPQAAAEPDT